jgi:hypothetical protein
LTEKLPGNVLPLVGRTGMEDALKKLDELTNDEARMATAQVLRSLRTVDDRVAGVDGRVAGVDDRVVSIDGILDMDQLERSSMSYLH